MTTDVAELTCTCGHGQGSHEPATHGDDPMCMGFHGPDHPFADPELVLTSREYGCSCEAFTLATPAEEPQPFTVPEGWVFLGLGICRSCNQSIAWALTKNDKRAPINRDGSSHFATCQAADSWRHRGRRG